MPSLSTTMAKVMEITNDPNATANELNQIISLDPVLTGQVLKLINSAYYSLQNQITSLSRAIIMLGMNTVKNLALSTAVLESMGNKHSFKALSMDDFWTHSLGTGVLAKHLSSMLGIPVRDREEFFVAGLMHDLGKIPLNAVFPREYKTCIKVHLSRKIPLEKVEKNTFDLDHGEVGRRIAEKWRLNRPLHDAMGFHHQIDEVSQPSSPAPFVVAVADAYTINMRIGTAGTMEVFSGNLSEMLIRSGLPLDMDINRLHETTLEELDKARIFLQVTQGDFNR
ncbi:MAG: HDOD domain-containing protein [Deltaproteobacteria bacterium]|nr:HDOD domain-containing protein [Deltaproteobacteria bacterium]